MLVTNFSRSYGPTETHSVQLLNAMCTYFYGGGSYLSLRDFSVRSK